MQIECLYCDEEISFKVGASKLCKKCYEIRTHCSVCGKPDLHPEALINKCIRCFEDKLRKCYHCENVFKPVSRYHNHILCNICESSQPKEEPMPEKTITTSTEAETTIPTKEIQPMTLREYVALLPKSHWAAQEWSTLVLDHNRALEQLILSEKLINQITGIIDLATKCKQFQTPANPS